MGWLASAPALAPWKELIWWGELFSELSRTGWVLSLCPTLIPKSKLPSADSHPGFYFNDVGWMGTILLCDTETPLNRILALQTFYPYCESLHSFIHFLSFLTPHSLLHRQFLLLLITPLFLSNYFNSVRTFLLKAQGNDKALFPFSRSWECKHIRQYTAIK